MPWYAQIAWTAVIAVFFIGWVLSGLAVDIFKSALRLISYPYRAWKLRAAKRNEEPLSAEEKWRAMEDAEFWRAVWEIIILGGFLALMSFAYIMALIIVGAWHVVLYIALVPYSIWRWAWIRSQARTT